jgi:hypothetical protein
MMNSKSTRSAGFFLCLVCLLMCNVVYSRHSLNFMIPTLSSRSVRFTDLKLGSAPLCPRGPIRWLMSTLQGSTGDPSSAKKRVGVIGSGAVGLYYGARLLESGNDVSFLCRRDADAIREKGLTVNSFEGNMYFPPSSLQIHTNPEDMGTMDWVVLALKSYSLPAAAALAR